MNIWRGLISRKQHADHGHKFKGNVYVLFNPQCGYRQSTRRGSDKAQSFGGYAAAWDSGCGHPEEIAEIRRICHGDIACAITCAIDPHNAPIRGMNMSDTHKEYAIKYLPQGSCHWQATRYGVRLRARSREELLRAVDKKVQCDLEHPNGYEDVLGGFADFEFKDL